MRGNSRMQLEQYEVEQGPGLVSIPSLGGFVTNLERSIAGREICLGATCRINTIINRIEQSDIEQSEITYSIIGNGNCKKNTCCKNIHAVQSLRRSSTTNS